jgi:hypothetical protein
MFGACAEMREGSCTLMLDVVFCARAATPFKRVSAMRSLPCEISPQLLLFLFVHKDRPTVA